MSSSRHLLATRDASQSASAVRARVTAIHPTSSASPFHAYSERDRHDTAATACQRPAYTRIDSRTNRDAQSSPTAARSRIRPLHRNSSRFIQAMASARKLDTITNDGIRAANIRAASDPGPLA